jgi:metal-responsive CopG/Arc/MetJ family transcriptional regulator
MTSISLKIDDKILSEADYLWKEGQKSRNSYFNEAIAFYNSIKKKELLAKQLAKESELVKASSKEVLSEMEKLEGDYGY